MSTPCLKKISYLIIFTTFRVSPSLLSNQKCLRNHKRIFIDANKYLPFPVLGGDGIED